MVKNEEGKGEQVGALFAAPIFGLISYETNFFEAEAMLVETSIS